MTAALDLEGIVAHGLCASLAGPERLRARPYRSLRAFARALRRARAGSHREPLR